jgi:hypothetical protein
VPASGGKDCSPSLVSDRASTVAVNACGAWPSMSIEVYVSRFRMMRNT